MSRRTLTFSPPGATIDTVGGEPAHGDKKELSMADTDLSARFEKISDSAKTATDKP